MFRSGIRWLVIITLIMGLLVPLAPPDVRAAANPALLRLRSGAFDPLSGEPAIPGTYRATLQEDWPGLRLVQFTGPIRQAWVEALERSGAHIVTYLPDYAYLVWSDARALQGVQALAPVRWSGPYHPYYALHPDLRLVTASEVDVLVQLYAGPLAREVQQAILTRASAVTRQPRSSLAYINLGVRLAARDLPWLVALPGVVNVEPRPQYHKLDEVQNQIMAGALNTDGTQPDGPGYLTWLLNLGFPTDPTAYPIVDVTDDGIDNGTNTPLHADFYVFGSKTNPDRLVYNANWTSDASADGRAGHGNINASIVGGYNAQTGTAYEDSNGYNYGLGVNPFGRLAGSKVFNNAGYWDLPNDDYAALISQGYAQGMRISSNSWGADTGGTYTTDDQTYDALVRDAQSSTSGNQEVIVVFAAGNAGSASNTVGSPGVAKNVITVGAAENVRPTWTDGCGIGPSGADNAMDIISFSSRGPTDDLRVKPDLVAPGTHIQGAASQASGYDGSGVCDPYQPSGQTLYAASSGTSHSTPAVAGAASLVYRYYQDHFGGTPPSPAMVKAYLLNSTRYLTGVSANDTLPSNNQGLGEIDLGRAFDATPRLLVDQSVRFDDSGQTFELQGAIADASQPFRITLAWTDAPGPTVGAAYVNNLDLELDLNGVLYRGNGFSGATTVPGGSADARNNVESIFLPAGTIGAFTVRVRATNIAGDGVPGVGDTTDQDFALVIYNGTQQDLGTLTGIVRAADTAQPLAGARIQATLSPTQTFQVFTDAQGRYTLRAFAGTYSVTASRYGYLPVTVPGVTLSANVTNTLDLELSPAPTYTVSGVVRDAATGWPLYAAIAISGEGYPGATVWTNPESGAYTVDLVAGQSYTFDVSAWVQGYQPTSRSFTLTEPRTEDVDLSADLTSCTAPGYTLSGGLRETFDGVAVPGLPVTWATEAVSGAYVWQTSAATVHPSGGQAHSAPNLVYYPSYSASSGSSARLYTTQGLTLNPGASLTFWMYHDTGYSTYPDRVQAQVSVNGGDWTNVGGAINRYDGSTGWKQHTVGLDAYAGQSNVRVALLAISGYGNDLHVDDVQIGSPTCQVQAGGLLVGTVADANTGAALNGATLTAAGRTTSSAATPLDAALPDGFYTLFLPTGPQTVTVNLDSYAPAVLTLAPLPGAALWQDVDLAAGWPQAAPTRLTSQQELGTQRVLTLTLSNPGGAPYTFALRSADPSYQPLASGGPDPFGYTFVDSREPNGPLFEWLDVTDGTPLNLSDDGEATITLPFALTFYGQSSDTLRVGNNGAVLFNASSGDVAASNSDLGSASTNYLIAPFWDDLDETAGNVYWKVLGEAPYRRAVIAWVDRPHYPNTGAATLELVLYEGQGSFKVQYLDVDFGNAAFDRGAGATVGIRGSGSTYLQYAYNTPTLDNALAICFVAPGETDCDPEADWLSFTPESGTVPAGESQVVQVSFNALSASVPDPGSYRATLRVLTDSPYPDLQIPVTMTVTAPTDWGALTGTVLSDRPGGPLAAADVRAFSDTTLVRATQSDAAGHYTLPLPAGEFQVRFSAPGYITQVLTVTVTSAVTTTLDALLQRDAPGLAYAPPALSSVQLRDTRITATLTLTNTGLQPLTYRILELDLPTQQRTRDALPLLTDTGALRVDHALEARLAQGERADLWVRLRSRPDLRAVSGTKAERGAQVYAALRATADRTQTGVMALLDKRGLAYERFWIVNALLVHNASLEDLRALQALPEVREITARFAATLQTGGGTLPNSVALLDQVLAAYPAATVAWGLNFTGATQVWEQYGIRGEGIVVANIDTGVQWDHPALQPQYRGWNGSSADHDYAWYAPTITATTACAGAALAPCDWNNHGTHTMGTMVGDTRGGTTGTITGMAPRATWMACMGCDTPPNACSDEALTVCAQWFLAPTDLNGNNPDPARAPHIINNSWGDTGGNPWYEAYVEAWVAAGIFPAFSAGNSGSGCSTTGSPGDYALAFASAAVDSAGTVASFSSRGPGLIPGVSMKPDLAAPGVSVYSTIRGSGYGTMSGTSMASPHTAGAVALIWSANPGLRGQVLETFDLLRQTAQVTGSEGNCGKPAGTVGPVPNYTYGYGYLDALAAVEAALQQLDVPWLTVEAPEGTLASGQSRTLAVVFDATGLEPATYSATLRLQHNDPLQGEVNIPVTLRVLDAQPSLILNKQASALTVEAGQRVTYTLMVTNTGGAATNLRLSDPLPEGTTFAWADQGGSLVGDAVEWTAAALPSQATLQARFAVTVSCVPSGTLIINPGFRVSADELAGPLTSAPFTLTVRLTPPQADFQVVQPLLRAWPGTFVNQSSGAAQYRWDFGDGQTSTAVNPTHTYAQSGNYTVELTAYHACPDVLATVTRTVTVHEYALALTALTPTQSADPGAELALSWQVTNTGTLPATLALSWNGPAWGTLTPSSVALAPGASAPVTLSLTVPAFTAPGAYGFAVTARVTEDPRTPAAQATASALVTVNPVYGLELTPQALVGAALTGDSVSYRLYLTHTSNLTATWTPVVLAGSWPVTFAPGAPYTLAPGESREVEVQVGVPEDAPAGSQEVTRLGWEGPDVGPSVTLTTTALCRPLSWLDFTWTPAQPHPGQTVTLTAQAQGSQPIDYTWFFDDGTDATGVWTTYRPGFVASTWIALTAYNPCSSLKVEREMVLALRRLYLPLVVAGQR